MSSKKKTGSKSKKLDGKTVSVSDCVLSGPVINFDAGTVNVIRELAKGLYENARGLASLAETMSGNSISIGPLMTIGEPEK